MRRTLAKPTSTLATALFLSLTGTAALGQDEAVTAVNETTPARTLPEYRINPGDVLEISVWREDQLQRAVTVLPDGSLSFPLVGRIEGAGKTTREIEQAISLGLANKYVDGNVPDVTVAVSATSGLQFSVIGKVRSPGTFTPGRYINILEALSIAGGVTEFASLSSVKIIRKTDAGPTIIPVRLSSVLKSGNVRPSAVSELPLIRSGDTVIVP